MQDNAELLVPPSWSDLSLARTLGVRDRVRGSLVGLAAGDALGTTVEFNPPGSFTPLTDMVGGGPFHLAAGDWTDDTSMALCLAESLIEKRGFDAADQMQRYVRWWRDGHLSSTGRCFDIGTTTREALARFERTGDAYAGSTERSRAANGSLMRLAPVPLFYWTSPEAIAMSGRSSRTTHGSPLPVDACRYLGALIVGAVRGATRDELLAPHYEPWPGCWDEHPLAPEIAAIAAGSFHTKQPPAIRGTGYCVDALEAALWAFASSPDFRSGALLAVNLGDDADTTGAIYGQLAGAFYGESGIPLEWRRKLALKATLDRYAEFLFQLSVSSGDAEADGSDEDMVRRVEVGLSFVD
jgi:ADP-ribosyl-[dinitrogen reductase] hydrolase